MYIYSNWVSICRINVLIIRHVSNYATTTIIAYVLGNYNVIVRLFFDFCRFLVVTFHAVPFKSLRIKITIYYDNYYLFPRTLCRRKNRLSTRSINEQQNLQQRIVVWVVHVYVFYKRHVVQSASSWRSDWPRIKKNQSIGPFPPPTVRD